MNTTHPENSWNTPRRQSPAAIIIMLLQSAVGILKAFWPVVIVYFLRKDNDENGFSFIWLVLSFSGVAMIAAVVKYFFYTFYLRNDNLVIQSGWIKKKTLTVPLKNIQGVNLRQNIWQKILKVATVTLDSAGSEKVEVEIDALQIKKAEELKQQLLSGQNSEQAFNQETITEPVLFQLTMPDLLKLSLSANHLEAFFILFGLSLNLVDDVQKIFNIDGWKMMGDYANKLAGEKILSVTMLIIFVAGVSVLVSMLRTILKYYDFKLEESKIGWKAYFGLITSQQVLIPVKKIQIFSWKANLLRRKLNFWIVQIQAIGHDEVTRKQQVHIPVTNLDIAIKLSRFYQTTRVLNKDEGLKISDSYWKRKTLFRALPSTLILSAIIYFFLPGFAWIGLLLFPAVAVHHYIWYRNFRWTSNNEGVQMFSGVWGRKYSLLTWKKIQQVEIKQSLHQQRAGLSSLIFKTAGGNLVLHYIPYETGLLLCNKILYIVESQDPDWM